MVYNYKGYTTTVEYDEEDDIYYGKIEGIKDLVSFHSEQLENFEKEFQSAVDDYLLFCEEVKKEPEKPSN